LDLPIIPCQLNSIQVKLWDCAMDSKFLIKPISSPVVWCALIMLGSAMLGGCHAGFHKRWRAIENQRPTSAAVTDPMLGLWDGYWIDTNNFHAGRLRAIVSKKSDQHYKVDFLANFAALIIPCGAEYSITLQSQAPKDGQPGVSFHGENDLGFFFGAGGIYKYRGSADGVQWVNTFESKSGRGEFRLHRPGAIAKKPNATAQPSEPKKPKKN